MLGLGDVSAGIGIPLQTVSEGIALRQGHGEPPVGRDFPEKHPDRGSSSPRTRRVSRQAHIRQGEIRNHVRRSQHAQHDAPCALAKALHKAENKPGKHRRITGLKKLGKVINITQSPIGRTPRSNPATYVKLMGHIRDLFSMLPDSKARGYKPGRFSFNVKGGRCEACRGHGKKRVEMHFLADVWVTCNVCKGTRFNNETLQIHYKGKNISDVLKMDVDEALKIF